MKVSSSFYFRSWFKNSLMAIGTGFVVGYFSSVLIMVYAPPINGFIGAFIGLIIYQYISFDLFFGTRRGKFEYEYRIDLAEKIVKKLILRSCGLCTYIIYFQDQFNAIRSAQKDICQKLLQKETISKNNEYLYYIYYKLSNLELREDNFEKEKKMLNSAITINPSDLLANFRFAACCEMDGLIDDAISHYKLASKDPNLISDQLRKYILSQIERIKLKGPMNRSPALGLKYQGW